MSIWLLGKTKQKKKKKHQTPKVSRPLVLELLILYSYEVELDLRSLFENKYLFLRYWCVSSWQSELCNWPFFLCLLGNSAMSEAGYCASVDLSEAGYCTAVVCLKLILYHSSSLVFLTLPLPFLLLCFPRSWLWLVLLLYYFIYLFSF